MSPETIEYLNRPELRRLLFSARERFERNAGPYGRLQLTALSRQEAHALNGLLTPQQPFLPGADALIKLPRLDAQLRGSRLAVSLEEALVALDGPLANLREERAAAAATREAAWGRVLAHPQAGRPELEPWLDHVRRRFNGAAPERTAIVLQALDVLTVLLAEGIPLAALAASYAGGDAHALDRNRPLGRPLPAALLALEGPCPGSRRRSRSGGHCGPGSASAAMSFPAPCSRSACARGAPRAVTSRAGCAPRPGLANRSC